MMEDKWFLALFLVTVWGMITNNRTILLALVVLELGIIIREKRDKGGPG